MSSRYQVFLHVSGLSVPCEGHDPIQGFYTAKRVVANDDKEAERLAMEELMKEPKVQRFVSETKRALGNSDSCRVHVEECFQISWWRWTFTRTPRGLILYAGDV